MEIVPSLSLYRGLYEFAQYAFTGDFTGTNGMRWGNINDSQNGMKNVLIIMTIEWLLLLPIAYYLDQVSSFGGGMRKSPLFFLQHFRKRKSLSFRKPSLQRDASKVFVEMDRPDVAQEVRYYGSFICLASLRLVGIRYRPLAIYNRASSDNAPLQFIFVATDCHSNEANPG